MLHVYRIAIAALMLLGVSTAHSADTSSLEEGADIALWQQTTEMTDTEEKIETYRAFIRTYPLSRFAEVAWVRLLEMDAQRGGWQRGLKRTLVKLEKTRRVHARNLQREQAPISTEKTLTASASGRASGPRNASPRKGSLRKKNR